MLLVIQKEATEITEATELFQWGVSKFLRGLCVLCGWLLFV